jgi:hypothetical protein
MSVTYIGDANVISTNISSISFDGEFDFTSATNYSFAKLVVAKSDGMGFDVPITLSKTPVLNAKFGQILLHKIFYSHFPPGKWLADAISAGGPIFVTVEGDSGHTFIKGVYDFGSTTEREELTSQARKKLAKALVDGCQPSEPMAIAP